MSGIRGIINEIKAKQNNLSSEAEILIEKDKKRILDYVRIDQLFVLGKDADGNKLKPYAPYTRSVKSSQGRDPNVVTLFDEGNYYRGFDLRLILEDVLNIFSTDFKANDLIEKYGSRIDDLNDENEQKVELYLEQNLISWVLEIKV